MSPIEVTIRPMERQDLADVDRIQSASPEASQWKSEDYLVYQSVVAELHGRVAGFAVARTLPPDELEILNVATDPSVRRQGVGGALVQALLSMSARSLFLEVRESNVAARALYRAAGFADTGRRRKYYPKLGIPNQSREDAIVMKRQK